MFCARARKIQKVIDTISAELPNFRMDELNNIIETALKNELDESLLVKAQQQTQAYKLARELIEEKHLDKIKKRSNELEKSHPGSPITHTFTQIVSGKYMPTVRRAEELLEEAETPGEKHSELVFESIWSKIIELEEGNIVLIDVE